MATLKERVFEQLNNGILSPTEIANNLDADPITVMNYKSQWKKEQGINKGPAKNADELADRLFGDQKEGKIENLKEATEKITAKKTFVPKQEANKRSEKRVKSMLKLVTESKTYSGKYATYVVTDGVAEIKLKDGPTLVDKPVLAELVEELNELGGLM